MKTNTEKPKKKEPDIDFTQFTIDDIARRMLATPPKPKLKKITRYDFKIDWPSFDAALAKFGELVELSFNDIKLANLLNSFGDSGLPFMVAHFDEKIAKITGYAWVRYQIADELRVYSTTVGTGNI
ncbi:MAG: hypothetical protein WAK96_00770 [Desulfobaccales bacterium]